ncbi:hypothetical protein LTR53_009104 [Teratosphaeriaceae sp. CCFEE 6253]|nr:hypothetical protein LTR53_009104 [Teratosphaeriaceae sp. CCFEE 6253]
MAGEGVGERCGDRSGVLASWTSKCMFAGDSTSMITRHQITKTTGNIVLSRGGVIRGITNWGTFLLPKPARKQGALYTQGHYFILRFDSGAQTQHAVRRTLGLDPRMIRYSVVKMGSKLEEIADVGGKAEWENDGGRMGV